jgi:poly(3-hydroxybutyrate) depolymerase
VSDKVFTTDLVDYLKENYCVDPDRIYAAGFSNGGGFAASLACDKVHGAQFAAFAPVGAALYKETPENNAACAPAEVPVPMLELHGTDDETIAYNGGIEAGGRVPAIPEWFERWADRNDCGKKVVKELPNNVEHWTWDCGNGSGNPLLQHYKANGLGHVWPDAAGPIDISTVIIDFFLNQSK